MNRYFLLFSIILITGFCEAQEPNPKIGSEKGVREKLVRIKKGLPDIRKNLTKPDENFTDQYNVKFEMGNGIVIYREEEEDKEQTLTTRKTTSYFSGTVADYQAYYKTLTALIREVFGPDYEVRVSEKDKIWETQFHSKSKTANNQSKVYIMVSCSWVMASLGPGITIDILSRL